MSDKARELARKIAGAVEAGQELAGLSLHPLNRERMESLIREAVKPLVEAAGLASDPITRDLESTKVQIRSALEGWK